MTTNSINNYKLQTGVWTKPQIISFDSLFSTYSLKNVFGEKENEKITSVISEWKEYAKEHFKYLKSSKRAATLQPTFESYLKNDSKWTVQFSTRTAHVMHKDTPNFIYKSYMSAPGRGQPMANTLRAPMRSIIAQTITNENLRDMDVAKKGIIPILLKEEIEQLDERKINEAFITCCEKIDILDRTTTIKKIKEMPEQSQKNLAHQCCLIPQKTGLGDFGWHNLQMHAITGKLYILDTEPLYGELFIDKFGESFSYCAQIIDECTLKDCAKIGLTEFHDSSERKNLEIFQTTAQSFLEKID